MDTGQRGYDPFLWNYSVKDIQEQKDLLIGTNINVDDVNLAMKPSFDEIRRLQQKMALDIRTKIAEIKQRKGI